MSKSQTKRILSAAVLPSLEAINKIKSRLIPMPIYANMRLKIGTKNTLLAIRFYTSLLEKGYYYLIK